MVTGIIDASADNIADQFTLAKLFVKTNPAKPIALIEVGEVIKLLELVRKELALSDAFNAGADTPIATMNKVFGAWWAGTYGKYAAVREQVDHARGTKLKEILKVHSPLQGRAPEILELFKVALGGRPAATFLAGPLEPSLKAGLLIDKIRIQQWSFMLDKDGDLRLLAPSAKVAGQNMTEARFRAPSP